MHSGYLRIPRFSVEMYIDKEIPHVVNKKPDHERVLHVRAHVVILLCWKNLHFSINKSIVRKHT